MKSSRRSIVLISVFIACIVGIAAFFLFYTGRSAKEDLIPEQLTELTDWTYTLTDGSGGTVTLPYSFPVQNGEGITITAVLPQTLTGGEYLNLCTGADYELYINGKLRSSYRKADADIPGGSEKSIFFFIPLNADDAGDTVTIVRSTPHAGYQYFRRILVGDIHSIEQEILKTAYPSFFLAASLAFCSLFGICYSLILRLFARRKVSFLYFCMGLLLISVWLITDSMAFQLVFHEYYIDGVLSFLVALLTPFPFMVYLDELQQHRHHKVLSLGQLFSLGIFLLVCAAHFLGGVSLMDNLEWYDLLLILQGVPILIALRRDFLLKEYKAYHMILVGLVTLVVCSSVEVLMINLVDNRVDGLFILFSLFVLMLCAVVQQTMDSSKLLLTLDQKSHALDQMTMNAMLSITRAVTDPLTGIYNSGYLKDMVSKSLARQEAGSFLLMDLDNFKQVNDTQGHQAGDAILVRFAALLRECFRESDMVSRLGGDEFVVYMPGCTDRQLLEKKYRQIRKFCDSDELFTQCGCCLSLSMGIAIAPSDAMTMDDLYGAADRAMYAVKRSGKNGFRFADDLD